MDLSRLHAGGYAPRQLVSKVRSLSYSRSIMAVHLPSLEAEAEAEDSKPHAAADTDGRTSTLQYPLDQPQHCLATENRCHCCAHIISLCATVTDWAMSDALYACNMDRTYAACFGYS